MKTLVNTLSGFSIGTRTKVALQVALGSLLLVLCAQIKIPLYPVPMSMQTFGVFALAVMQGGKKASYSTLLYLALVTLGMPVLASGATSAFWWTLPIAGYLVGFPIAAYVIGKMVERRAAPTALWIVASILVGQAIIYTLGLLGLMQILSFKQSIWAGVIPFLPLAGIKMLLAATLGGAYLKWKGTST